MLSLVQNVGSLLDLPASTSQSDVTAKMVCFYLAQGEPVDSLSKKLRISAELIDRIQKSPAGSELIVRLQTAFFPDVGMRIKRSAHLAMDAKMKILLTTSNEALRNTVATDILDRSEGKPTQVTENRNINFDAKSVAELDRQIEASKARLDKIDAMKRQLKLAEKT